MFFYSNLSKFSKKMQKIEKIPKKIPNLTKQARQKMPLKNWQRYGIIIARRTLWKN